MSFSQWSACSQKSPCLAQKLFALSCVVQRVPVRVHFHRVLLVLRVHQAPDIDIGPSKRVMKHKHSTNTGA